MNSIKNVGTIDRIIRLFLAEIFFMLGFYWFGGAGQVGAYILAGIMLVTAVVSFCPLYKLFRVDTSVLLGKVMSKTMMGILGLIFLAVAVGGSYASYFFSKKFFLEDYNEMNQSYKQALFFTGQENRSEAISNYTELVTRYFAFQTKYQSYHPYVISHDENFDTDLEKVSDIIAALEKEVMTGDLKAAHVNLEQVRPVFQDILKRNGFSLLAVYLVDFHDTMEKIIEAADAKDSNLVLEMYPVVNEKLVAVEEVANDAEIQAIRQNLEQLVSIAKSGNTETLPVKAAELKSSFVKVYLKRG